MNSSKLVIGLGTTGKAVAKFLLGMGENVRAVDKRELEFDLFGSDDLLEKGLEFRSETDSSTLEGVDQVILSPGIPVSHPLVQQAIQKEVEVIGEIELAFRHMDRPMLGITGTNGKTTVTALASHVLNACGVQAQALGNIGIPLISEVSSKGVAVIELSSFQLETLSSRKLLSAAILNITPDHLDRYKSFEKYAETKFSIQNALVPQGKLIIEASTAEKFYKYVDPAYTPLLYSWAKSSIRLPEHLSHKCNIDAENMIAAYHLVESFGISEDRFLEATSTFKKAPHRIEFVRDLNGVRFWNDSKGTNIDATKKAVEYMEGPVILIAGGVDKGSPYTPLIETFQGKVKQIICLGQAAEKIERDLGKEFPTIRVTTLAEALEKAIDLGDKGDNILLSPICSSFDMFRNYKDRGEQFTSLVRSLV